MLEDPVTITPRAQQEITETLSANKIPDTYGLRVGIKGGGCSGSFVLGFDTIQEHDKVYHIDNIKVVIDQRHFMYVLGVEVDYSEDAGGYTLRSASHQS